MLKRVSPFTNQAALPIIKNITYQHFQVGERILQYASTSTRNDATGAKKFHHDIR